MMKGWHKYYCPLRPPDIGAVPPRPVRVEHVACVAHGRECYGAVYYDRRLSAVEVDAYELLEEEEEPKMREIKFRAWDSNHGVMCCVLVIDGWGNDNCGKFSILGRDSQNGMYRPLYVDRLMQFIGMKDKNGVEIYEGDVIRGHTGRYQVDCVVRWSQGNCGFIAEPTIIERTYLCLNPGSTKRYEVIGNIYENPELVNNEADT